MLTATEKKTLDNHHRQLIKKDRVFPLMSMHHRDQDA